MNDTISSRNSEHCGSYFSLICFFYRALRFIIVFLREVLTGEEDLVKCAKKAYENSLKRFHGWMVQGVFSVSFIGKNMIF